jgi:hypothetical protein
MAKSFSPKGGKSFKVASRTPSSAFGAGARPANTRLPGIQRIKPASASTTQYGKDFSDAGPGNTDSMDGLS